MQYSIKLFIYLIVLLQISGLLIIKSNKISLQIRMSLTFRLEEENDYEVVENLTREAFWNNFMEGCDEHFLLHKMRDSSDYLRAHYLAVLDNEIVGSIVYSKSKIIKDDGNVIDTVTIGPISVLPSKQKLSIGRKLIFHTSDIIRRMGYPAIIIYGDPRYYGQIGFRCCEKYDITTKSGKYSSCLLIYLLDQSIANNLAGRFEEGSIFEEFMTSEEEFNNFDSKFPSKEKFKTKSQNDFSVMITMNYKDTTK